MPQLEYRTIPTIRPEDEVRFWKFVDKGSPDECWPWLGTTTVHGYGVFYFKKDKYYAIRVMHALHYGADPGKFVVRHTCDTPGCVNFNHHRLGTHRENMQDAAERNRFASGSRNGTNTHPESRPTGEAHAQAKLTADQVVFAREQYAAGESCRDISYAIGVSAGVVQKIVHGEIWKSAGGPIVKTDITPRGERSRNSTLTEQQVLEILTKRDAGQTIQSIADDYGVTQGAITAIIYGKTWTHLKTGMAKSPKKQLSLDTVASIRSDFNNGETMGQLALKYGVARSSISNVVNRVTWAQVK